MGLFGFGKGPEVPFSARQGGGEVGTPQREYLSPNDPLPDEGDKESGFVQEGVQSVREALENVAPESSRERDSVPDGARPDEERNAISVSRLHEKFPRVPKFLTALMLVSLGSTAPKKMQAQDFLDRIISQTSRQLERSVERTASRVTKGIIGIPEKGADDYFKNLERRRHEKRHTTNKMIEGVQSFEIETSEALQDLSSLRNDYDRAIRQQADLADARDLSEKAKDRQWYSLHQDYLQTLERIRDRYSRDEDRMDALLMETRLIYGNNESVQRKLDEYGVIKERRVRMFDNRAQLLYEYISSKLHSGSVKISRSNAWEEAKRDASPRTSSSRLDQDVRRDVPIDDLGRHLKSLGVEGVPESDVGKPMPDIDLMRGF